MSHCSRFPPGPGCDRPPSGGGEAILICWHRFNCDDESELGGGPVFENGSATFSRDPLACAPKAFVLGRMQSRRIPGFAKCYGFLNGQPTGSGELRKILLDGGRWCYAFGDGGGLTYAAL